MTRSENTNGQYKSLDEEDTESLASGDQIYEDTDEFEDNQHKSLWTQRRYSSLLCNLRWLLDFILLIVAVISLSIAIRSSSTAHKPIAVAEDVTGFAPKFKQNIVSFSPDETFVPRNTSEFFTAATYEKWLTIIPRGLGFIKIESPSELTDLPTKLNIYPNDNVYTTSMTHQLHCLYAIAGAYSNLHAHGTKAPTERHWHLMHCFDYIRQGIMCAGDIAIEGQATTFPPGITGSDGWDAKHVCKDYSEVYNYLEQNRALDSHWI